mgnify:CR=1 FL=1
MMLTAILSKLRQLIYLIYSIILIGGSVQMVDMYVALVIAGRRTCNPENKSVPLVPTRYRKAVTTELEALGLDADGNPVTTVA